MVISLIYLSRGLLAIPVVLLVNHPYANELKHKMLFMILSSLFCLIVGLCYAVGAYYLDWVK